MIHELISKIKFDLNSDRIGPDCPFTHWNLYLKIRMKKLCQRRFGFFGEGSEFRPGAYAVACSNISIGNNVVIRPSSMLFAYPDVNEINIIIEDNVLIGSGVHIYSVNHKFGEKNKEIINQGHFPCKKVTINKGAWVGANSVILPGVSIGRFSVIGAGSIVTKNIPDNSLAVGNPAKVIRFF